MSTLYEWVIEISAAGSAAVQGTLAQMQGQLTAGDAAAKALANTIGNTLNSAVARSLGSNKEIAAIYAKQAEVVKQVNAAVASGSMSAEAGLKAVKEANAQAQKRVGFEQRSQELAKMTAQAEEQQTRRKESVGMSSAAGNAAQQAAMAQVQGQKKAQAIYEGLAGTIKTVRQAFVNGAIDAESAQKKIQAATNKTNLEIAAQQKATRDAAAAQQRAAQQHAAGMRVIAGAYATVSGTVMGYVRAGLQGTAQGNMIGLQMERISREVANLFLPAINAVVNALDRVTTWFRTLSGQQQESIGRWIAVGTAALGAATMLPRIAAGFQMVGVAMKAAIAGNPIGMIAVAAATVVAFLASTRQGQETLGKLFESFKPLLNTLSNYMETIAPTLDVVTDAVQSVAEALVPIVSVYLRAWASQMAVVGEIVAAVMPVIDLIGAAFADVATILTPLMNAVEAGFQRIFAAIKPLIAAIMRLFPALDGNAFQNTLTTIGDIAGGIAGAFELVVGWIEKALEAATAFAEELNRAGSAASTVGNTIANTLSFGLVQNPFGNNNPDRQQRQSRRQREERRPHNELDVAGGGFRDVRETFRALQTAANRTDFARQQLEATHETNRILVTHLPGLRRPTVPSVGN